MRKSDKTNFISPNQISILSKSVMHIFPTNCICFLLPQPLIWPQTKTSLNEGVFTYSAPACPG